MLARRCGGRTTAAAESGRMVVPPVEVLGRHAAVAMIERARATVGESERAEPSRDG